MLSHKRENADAYGKSRKSSSFEYKISFLTGGKNQVVSLSTRVTGNITLEGIARFSDLEIILSTAYLHISSTDWCMVVIDGLKSVHSFMSS